MRLYGEGAWPKRAASNFESATFISSVCAERHLISSIAKTQTMPLIDRKYTIPYFGNYFVYRFLCTIVMPLFTTVILGMLVYKKFSTPVNCVNPGFYDDGDWSQYSNIKCWILAKFHLHLDMEGKKGFSEYTNNTASKMFGLIIVSGVFIAMWVIYRTAAGCLMENYYIKTMDIINKSNKMGHEELDTIVLTNIDVVPVIRSRSWLLVYSTFMKSLYFGFVMLQFWTLKKIVGQENTTIWSIKILSSRIFSTPSNFTTTNFPYSAYCSVVKDRRHYTFPCTILFNEFEELVCALDVLWMVFLALLISYDIIQCLRRYFNHSYLQMLMKEIYGNTISLPMAQQIQNRIGFDTLVVIKKVFDFSNYFGEKLMRNILKSELAKRNKEIEELLNGNGESLANTNIEHIEMQLINAEPNVEYIEMQIINAEPNVEHMEMNVIQPEANIGDAQVPLSHAELNAEINDENVEMAVTGIYYISDRIDIV
ncbi:unnamed protein product [Caenorhabditis bovis]|uniref:Innexin n=1 Tax=Caenorhabditis bovis TaxID=2654633 RepID=A0A8S1ED62_9PELO|nr:unnamed protein product [Caenorhabditis bovis]